MKSTLAWPLSGLTLVALMSVTSIAQTADKAEFLNSAEYLKRGSPLSQAVRSGDPLFLSGQLGTDPKTNALVPGGVEPESRQALTNVRAIIEANGGKMSDVIKCTIFLADVADREKFNVIYKEFFKAPFPTRSAVGVSGLAVNARVEVECVAHVPK